MRSLCFLLLWCGCAEASRPTASNVMPASAPVGATLAASRPVTPSSTATKPVRPPLDSEADDAPAPPEKVPSLSAGEKLIALPGASLPLKTFALSGPYKTYEAFCRASLLDLNTWAERNTGAPETPLSLEEVCPKKRYKKTKDDGEFNEHNEIISEQTFPDSTYVSLKIVHHQNLLGGYSGRGSVELALQTKEGWYGAQLLSYTPYTGDAGNTSENLREVKQLELIDAIPGGEPELVFTIRSLDDDDGRATYSKKQKELLFVCGLNEKKQPACYPPIRVFESEESGGFEGSDDDAPAKKTIKKTRKLKEPYLKDGQLTLAPEEGSDDFPKRLQALFGAHVLVFP